MEKTLSDVILLFDKKKGITSFRAIEEVRRILGVERIGHSGTLDKSASGLLVICTGRATKLTRYFLVNDKRYIGVIQLGVITDTCDGEGEIIERRQCPPLEESALRSIERAFTGEILQKPPRYSAVKISGKRASDRARAGEDVEIKTRRVRIDSLRLSRYDAAKSTLRVEVDCSKGTYIRSLARDIGEYLGTGAHLADLRRIGSGAFSVEEAVTIEELADFPAGGRIGKKFIYTPLEGLSHLGMVIVREGVEQRVRNGAAFTAGEVLSLELRGGEPSAVLDSQKNLIAIAELDPDNWSVRYLNVFNW